MSNKVNLRELILNILLEIEYVKELWNTGYVWTMFWTSFPLSPQKR